MFGIAACAYAAEHEITYHITQYNASAGDFVISAHGERPAGAEAYFENDYGATTGNRYNQIPRNRQATLWLTGYEGCIIDSLTLYMCSNNSAGTFSLKVQDEESTIYTHSVADFTEWYGMWVSKDHNTYVAVGAGIPAKPIVGLASISINGGTREGSVYLQSITVHYRTEGATESPMGWCYQKLEAKSTLNEGDVVMLYRSGDAAADIDGMETSHYMDAIGVTSTSNVYEPDVLCFTLSRDESGSHWLLIDQWGRQLGAEKAQQLAWDQGVLSWDIQLGYNGATVSSTNSKYGCLRYNAPSGSYPRFWNYTSNTLPLPYLYRRQYQLTPVTSTGIELATDERTVLWGSQDTLMIRATLLPARVTDTRIDWHSSDEKVATVRDGIVSLQAPGDVVITATARDGGAESQLALHIVEPTGVSSPIARSGTRKLWRNHRIIIRHDAQEYLLDGTIATPLR